jgi:CheY-like chemotaxis protein
MSLESPLPSGLRVLVADDNPSNLGYARELLGGWGITPTVAADGAEAVALARKRGFDVILMDLQMPVLDGLAATKQIRRFEVEQSRSRTPVLAYTSHAVDECLLRHCGLDGVLEKPCSADALRACVARWCAPRSSPTSSPMDVWALPR